MSTQNDLQENLLNKEVQVPKKHVAKPVSFLALFKYADKVDKLLMFVGTITAMGAGVAMPFFMIFFSELSVIFIPGNEDVAQEKARVIAIKFFILGAATWFLNFLGLYSWGTTGTRQTIRFKKMYYKTLLQQQVAWYDSNDVNKLATQISANMVAVETAMGQKVSILLATTVTSIYGFFYAFFKCWRLSVVLTAFLPLMMIAGVLMMKSMQAKAQISKISYEDASGIAQQAFAAIKTVKSFVAETFEENKFIKALSQSQKKVIRFVLFSSISLAGMMLIFLGLYSFGFWYGKQLLIWDFGYDAPTVISTFFCFLIGGASVGQISPIMKNIAEGKVAAGSLYELIGRQKTLVQPMDGIKLNQVDLISFKNVTFKYQKIINEQKENNDSKLKPKDDKIEVTEQNIQNPQGQIKQENISNKFTTNTVLDQLNLLIKKGKVTAIVGESGSGKSTIIQLLMRYYDPTEGNIFVNGLKMQDIDIKSFRQRVGYVGQQPMLFSMSIAENLKLSNPDLTDQQIKQILKKANALQFVDKCADGIDTYVGSGGAQLSGGQKQRIAIARAIAKNPYILILDEATSALDRKNEKQIQKTLHNLSTDNMTTVVVAHRLSTIRNADHIIVLGKGKILEEGTHEELYQHEGPYYQLVKSQMSADAQNQANIEESKPSQTNLQQQKVQIVNKVEGVNTQVKEKKQQKQQQLYPKQKLDAVFGKLLKQSKGSYLYLFVGCLFALANGAIWPFFNVAFSNIMALMAQAKEKSDQINRYCLLFLLVAIVGSFTICLYNFCFGIAGQRLVYKLRTKLFIKLMYLPASFYDKPNNTPGGISTKLSTDSYQINNMITGVLAVMCLNISTVAVSLFFAFYYFWQLTLVVMALTPLMVITGAINMQVMKGMSQKSQKFQKAVGSLISDTVCNIRTVKSFGNQLVFQNIFADKLDVIANLSLEKQFKSSILQGLSRGSVMFVEGFTFWIAAIFFSRHMMSQGQGTEGIYIAVFSIIFAAMGVGQNSAFMPDMAKAKLAGASMYDILQSKDEVQFAKQTEDQTINNNQIQGDIEFKNVQFKYPERQAIVLKNFNLVIKNGQKIAFVGPSGSGKSTLVQILMRFYPIQSGQILVNGINFNKYNLHKYRKQIGLVSQQPTLFLGTIKQNIIYNAQIKKDVNTKIQKYTKVAHAYDFINDWPQKYDKEVGQKGSQVSGGQKQRIALARCLIRQPHIILLDQSTSALDADTQKIVFQNLKPILKKKTSISIAHRLSTIEDANRIIVMRDGEIIEEGGYEQLMNRKQNFYRLAKGTN